MTTVHDQCTRGKARLTGPQPVFEPRGRRRAALFDKRSQSALPSSTSVHIWLSVNAASETGLAVWPPVVTSSSLDNSSICSHVIARSRGMERVLMNL